MTLNTPQSFVFYLYLLCSVRCYLEVSYRASGRHSRVHPISFQQ